MVADIAKLSAGREDYYVREVAENREEYLSGHGESPGRWLGRGAVALGQQGTASKEAFVRVFHGRHPDTGEVLGRKHGTRARPAFDVVFRPVKSVSLLYGLGDGQVAANVLAAHQEATRQALGYLEDHVGVRRGHGGHTKLQAQGLLAVGFDHRTSRAGDPLLHTHVIIANRAQGPDGRWTALDGHDLWDHRLAADAIYRGTYQRALSRSLGVAWSEADRFGNREIVGMPAELVRVFSKRTDAIDCEIERLEAEGRVRTPKLVKWAVHSTRQAKQHEAPASLAERWRTEATQHGINVPELLRGVVGRQRQTSNDPAGTGAPEAATVVGVFDQLASPKGLTAQASTFARPQVIAALGDHLVATDRGQLEALADRFLEERAVSVVADRTATERRWSTPELLDVEHALVAGALARRGEHAGVCSPETVREALAEHSTIGEDQAGMVRDLTLSPDGVRWWSARPAPARPTPSASPATPSTWTATACSARRRRGSRRPAWRPRGSRRSPPSTASWSSWTRTPTPAAAMLRAPPALSAVASPRPGFGWAVGAGGGRGEHGRLPQAHPPAGPCARGGREGGAGRR